MPSPARPPGISILIASAPQSTSCRTHVGPARARVRSRTLYFPSGRDPLSGMVGSLDVSVWRDQDFTAALASLRVGQRGLDVLDRINLLDRRRENSFLNLLR